jgi:hypothetical protein
VAKAPFTESNGGSVTSKLYRQGSESRSDPTHRGNMPASSPRQTPSLLPPRPSHLAGAERCIPEPFGIFYRQESNTGRALTVADVGCEMDSTHTPHVYLPRLLSANLHIYVSVAVVNVLYELE